MFQFILFMLLVLYIYIILFLCSNEEYLLTIGKQWRDKKKHTIEKYRRFKNGVYSFKRYNSDGYTYEYVDSPLQSCFSNEKHFSSSSSEKNEIECVELEGVNYMISNNN